MAFVFEFYETAPTPGARQHKNCSCGWRLVSGQRGILLQLDTYGSADRQDVGTVSQSLQFDAAGVEALQSVLHKALEVMRQFESVMPKDGN